MALGNMLTRFGRDCAANVAVTFGLAILPTLALVGAATDYSAASSTPDPAAVGTRFAVLAAAAHRRR